MPNELTQPMSSLLVGGLHRFATCWRLERKDGVVLTYTEHDTFLVVDGESYSPVGGFDASAVKQVEGLAESSFDVMGVITDEGITDEDIHAGKYRDAKVEVFVVDWRFPQRGKFRSKTFYLQTPQWDGQVWRGEMSSMVIRLQNPTGRLWARNCDYRLGDAQCGVDLEDFKDNGTVSALVASRRTFTATGLSSQANFYRDGRAEWLTGDNAGLKFDVRLHTTNQVSLYIQTPYEIQVGDTFTIHPGCDRTLPMCRDRFGNKNRFGGCNHMPGPDIGRSRVKAR